MSPRSLPGMTMGARRRAARRYVAENFAARSTPQFVHVEHLLYAEARARYRIGERLRPCPGCSVCRDGVPPLALDPNDPEIVCDGSGVLPARRAR